MGNWNAPLGRVQAHRRQLSEQAPFACQHGRVTRRLTNEELQQRVQRGRLLPGHEPDGPEQQLADEPPQSGEQTVYE